MIICYEALLALPRGEMWGSRGIRVYIVHGGEEE